MYAIFRRWYFSLDLLRPIKFFNFFKSVVRVFARSFAQFIINFGWLVAIDALFVLTIGDIVAKAMAQAAAGKALDVSIGIIMLVQAVIWFLASSAFFLLIRKEDASDPKAYFKIYFFRYMQILFTFYCLAFLFIYCLLMAGITKLPRAPWIVWMFTQIVGLNIIFYWLDGKGYFADIAYSLEKAINLVFYNAPIFAVFLVTLWLSDYWISLLAGSITGKIQSHLLFASSSLYPEKSPVTFFIIAKVLALKYLVFVIEYFWLCMVFTFYRRKKHDQYAVSIFQKV